MLLPQVSSIIKFTLAGDPGDTDDQDCEDLGYAEVDIKSCMYPLFRKRKNIFENYF